MNEKKTGRNPLWIDVGSNTDLSHVEYLMVEMTNYCNLKCSFCNREEVISSLEDRLKKGENIEGLENATSPLKHLEPERFREILGMFKGQNIVRAKLQGLGEPYLDSKFPENVKVFREFFPDTFLICATSGQYGPRVWERFDKAMKHINLQYLSIDGLQENYERFRAPAKWNVLTKFLKHVGQQEFSKKCSINFVATEHNYRDIPGMLELTAQHDLGKLRINIAQEWNEEKTGELGAGDGFIDFLKAYKEYVIGVADWDYPQCYWSTKGAYIDVLGNIRMCPINTSGESFGNLGRGNSKEMQKRLIQIRNSKRFIEVHNGIINNNPAAHCKTCDYKRLGPILGKILNE
jgi:MoaA/NifB/PqqE/SkfB family radical SAM enzyme